MRDLCKLFFVAVVVVVSLCSFVPKVQASVCKETFSNKQMSSQIRLDLARLEGGVRMSARSRSVEINQHWFLESLFGNYEFVINEQLGGIQVAVVARGIEFTKPLKNLTQVILAHYFGVKNVTYPVRPDGTVAEHIIVNTSHGKWGRREIYNRLQDVKRNLNELPGRVKTTPELIKENAELVEDLVDFGAAHFPYVAKRKFVQRAAFLIPYFVQKQPNFKNFSFHPEIFSTRELSGDPKLAGVLKIIFQLDVSVQAIREELRQEFIVEFERELQELHIYRKRMEAWDNVLAMDAVEKISYNRSYVVLPANARKYLPKKYKLVVREVQGRTIYWAGRQQPIQRIRVYRPQVVPLFAQKEVEKAGGKITMGAAPVFVKVDNTVSLKSGEASYVSGSVTKLPTYLQGRDLLAARTQVGQDVNFDGLVRELGIDLFYGDELAATPMNRLIVSYVIGRKIRSLPEVVNIEDISRFSAMDLVERYGFTKPEMIELLLELDVHGVRIHFDLKWDKDNMRLQRELPQYYAPWKEKPLVFLGNQRWLF